MRKLMIAFLLSLTTAVPAMACPVWECQLDVSDYSCGGYHSNCESSYNYSGSFNCSYNYDYGSYNYNECSQERQPIYCQYCGQETWCCTCGGNYDCNYNSDYSYSGQNMSHWANIRDSFGNIIGQAGCGDSIEVCGVDSSDPDRVLIYDYSTGTYGSVLSECVYGGYSWDGSGDNGVYNSYQGSSCAGQQVSWCGDDGRGGFEYDCGYEAPYDGGYSTCEAGESQVTACAVGSSGYAYQYTEEIVTIIRRCMTILGGSCGWACF